MLQLLPQYKTFDFVTFEKLKDLKIIEKTWLDSDKTLSVEDTNVKTGVQSTWKYVKVD